MKKQFNSIKLFFFISGIARKSKGIKITIKEQKRRIIARNDERILYVNVGRFSTLEQNVIG